MAPEIVAEYKSFGIPISQGYGMTECSPRISTASFDVENIGDVGYIVNGCTVKIVDGEITVKSPSVMQGYYKNPEATAEALTEDGWLRTGDLGYVDDEDFIYITGRKKNVIVLKNGKNIYPEEIEALIDKIPYVAENVVMGEEEGDDYRLVAHIVYDPEAEQLKGKTPDEIQTVVDADIEVINDEMPKFKRIKESYLRTEPFEKTTTQKIKRRTITK